ncbi:hypothetical protein ACFQEX_17550 [Roseibium salinum]|uniref:hypothetical protein n=1 Tax=Roseibium salinum TaxID=1604349 RepID=UPI0036088183
MADVEPQPLSSIAPNAEFTLTTAALVDRPELSNLVTQIFSLWTVIEHDFQILFARIIGPDNVAAHAVYSALNNQGIQRQALNAAAKARFGETSEQFEVFSAVLAMCTRAGKIRHTLAHWRWGVSSDLPDALLLADPRDVKLVNLTMTNMRSIRPLDGEKHGERLERLFKNVTFDTSAIFVYQPKHLDAGLKNLGQAATALSNFDLYINPMTTAEDAEEAKRGWGGTIR